MKKASSILLLIAMIFGYVSLGVCLVTSIILFVYASPSMSQVIADGLSNGTIHTTFVGTLEEQVYMVQATLMASGIVVFIAGLVACLPSAIVFGLTRKKDTQGWYIASLILSILGWTILGLIGSILGLVDITAKPQEVPQEAPQDNGEEND